MEQFESVIEFANYFFTSEASVVCPYCEFEDKNYLNVYNHLREKHSTEKAAKEIPFCELIMDELATEYHQKMGQEHFATRCSFKCLYCPYRENNNWLILTDHVRTEHTQFLFDWAIFLTKFLQKDCIDLNFIRTAEKFTRDHARPLSGIQLVLSQVEELKSVPDLTKAAFTPDPCLRCGKIPEVLWGSVDIHQCKIIEIITID